MSPVQWNNIRCNRLKYEWNVPSAVEQHQVYIVAKVIENLCRCFHLPRASSTEYRPSLVPRLHLRGEGLVTTSWFKVWGSSRSQETSYVVHMFLHAHKGFPRPERPPTPYTVWLQWALHKLLKLTLLLGVNKCRKPHTQGRALPLLLRH